jgi:hypothetical protein
MIDDARNHEREILVGVVAGMDRAWDLKNVHTLNIHRFVHRNIFL